MNVFQNTIVMSEMNNESMPLLKRQNAILVPTEEIDFDNDGDEALYFLNEKGILYGGILTHVDDFNLAGTPDFIKKVSTIWDMN